MKKFTTFLAMAGIAASALGQNVIVVMKDGTSHKFNADYINEIRFTDDQSAEGTVRFESVSAEVYGYGNVSLTFSDATGENIAELDIYGSENATFFEPGTYIVEGSMNEFTIDPGYYSSLTINGNKLQLASGEMTVITGDRAYEITMSLVADNGTKLEGTYSGNLPTSYSLWPDMPMQQAWYNENEQAAGDFYVKFSGSGANYNSWEQAVVFTANASDTTLPEGTFTYSETRAPFTFGPASYIDTFRPSSTSRFLPGSEITVKKDGDSYVITMNLNLADGRNADISYNGQITGTPTFAQPEGENIVFESMSYRYYGSGNFCPIFFCGDISLELDMYGPDSAYLLPGTYTVGASDGNYIDTGDWSSYCVGDQIILLQSGTVTVADNNGTYTFDIDITLVNGLNVKGKYEGKIGGAYSSVINALPTEAFYNENPGKPGEFYVKMSCMDPSLEMAVDIFADTAATLLPAGKYTYSDDNTPGTFGQKSYVEMYGPYSMNRMKEGSEINVAVAGNVYTIEMTLLYTDGRTAYINYNGEISGTPAFE